MSRLAIECYRVILIYSIPAGELLTEFDGGNSGSSWGCWYSPDGARAARVIADYSISILDAETGEELARCVGHTDYFPGVNSIAFSPDGSKIASASNDVSVKIWDSFTGAELISRDCPHVLTVIFSPDSSLLAMLGQSQVRIVDVATGAELLTFTGHRDWISSAAFHPDGQSVASASADGTIKIWDVVTGREKLTLEKSRTGGIVSFTLDGSRLVVSDYDGSNGKNGITVWDMHSGEKVQTLTIHAYKRATMLITAHRQWIATTCGNNLVKVWDLSSGEEITSIATETDCRVICFRPEATLQLW